MPEKRERLGILWSKRDLRDIKQSQSVDLDFILITIQTYTLKKKKRGFPRKYDHCVE